MSFSSLTSALGSSSVQLGFHSNFLTEALHPSSKRKKLAFRKFTLSCSSSPSSDPLLVKAAKGHPVSRPPAWMMRQAGRYMAVYRKLAEKHPSFRERSETTDLIVQISLQPWEAFHPDGVIIFSDILTPLPAFGVPFDIEEVRGPVIQSPIQSEEGLKALHHIDLEKLQFVGDSLKILRKEVGEHAAVLGFVGAPWTIATYIVEGGTTRTYTTIKSMCHTAPHVLRTLLSHLTQAIADYIIYQVESGAHCIQIFDSWGGQLPPHMWEQWSEPYIREIVSLVRTKCPETPIVLYINGNGGFLERMKGTGVDVIGLDWTVDMADGRKRLGNDISVQGNVDPACLFSPLPALTDEIQRVVKCAGSRGHILNLGHGVLVGTPEEAVGNSFEDGVYGTTCPIPPGKNFTYILQVKDQIGSFYYFPSLAFHKAAGGFGGIRILSRPRIPVPFPDPAGDYTVLIGDWYKSNHTDLRAHLDKGKKLPLPDGILINGRGSGAAFNVEQGKTYRLRISNVGLQNSLNFRIQNHKMKLVEVEGTHTLQTTYSSLDVHVGQSYSVLVTADQPARDYYIVVSSRFTSTVLTTTGILHYSNSAGPVSGPIPGGPTVQIDWSLNQARSIRSNLTASGPRPNPQGSYHYGLINTTKTIRLSSSAGQVNGKQRYAINSVSFIPADTPLKLADYFKIEGVFRIGSISDNPTGGGIYLDTAVMGADYRAFIEIVFQNDEDIIQSYHLNGYQFWVVGMDGGQWTSASRNQYNLRDAVARVTVQVYPKSWSAIYIALDNVGMWNLRSESWARQYLGQQFYLRVYTASTSLRDEYPIPKNARLCGKAAGRHTRPL